MDHSVTTMSNILSPPELSPLEQEVLDEYGRLSENMKRVCLCVLIFVLSLFMCPHLCLVFVCSCILIFVLLFVLFPPLTAQLAALLGSLSGPPSIEILDGLRELERKTSLVFTTLKSSVYSIVLQQEIEYGDTSTRESG